MKKSLILEVLKEADEPLTVDELSKEVEVPVPRLRIDLYRLQSDGEVESRQEKGQLGWTIKVSSPVEEHYLKKDKKYTP